MSDFEKKIGKHKVKVVMADRTVDMTPDDKDMDARVRAAVNSAIHKAKVCQKPIAKYDQRKKKAYVEDSNGVRKYVS
ncbi:MAG: hypothetical protein K6F49_06990 [Saccharofermentans sp.]|nr:hypothetical protein [Saccharofermentans sp.]